MINMTITDIDRIADTQSRQLRCPARCTTVAHALTQTGLVQLGRITAANLALCSKHHPAAGRPALAGLLSRLEPSLL